MKETYLLRTDGSRCLYETYARDLPIIDFHNHVSVADIAENRRYENLTELWLAPDPYKHRLMRICGGAEHFITGDASPYEKMEAFCEIFPLLAGNPVYDWSRMELSRIFGIRDMPCKETAKRIYDRCGEMLRSPEYSTNAILSRFGVEYQSPVASLLDDLSLFDGQTVAPSLRGDNLLEPTAGFLAELKRVCNREITNQDSYIEAIGVLLDRFATAGCRFADHALDAGFFERDADGKKREILTWLGIEYAKRGWTLLLHLDAKRKTSTRLARVAGPAGGYAVVGGSFSIASVCDLLNQMEERGGLPDTVLFPLNMNDQVPLAVMQGSFSEDGIASKVQLGPAWWWCDHALGIENTLNCIASFGVVSQFLGMTTDSRSILSFVRHDYFRRLLCSWLDGKNRTGEWDLPVEVQGEIVRKICYQNAKLKIQR
ncbi:MAG: glucuronate isomerase [Clostridia bacterium]|nr:glucuronate isomerase [Clostridia bacterium]MBR6743635.1 glucuronate isomerase [Clostridia bacterium]